MQSPGTTAVILIGMHSQLLANLAIVLYLASSLILVTRLAGVGPTAQWPRAGALLVAFMAVLLHGGVLLPNLLTAHGLNLGFFNAASLIALLTAGLLLLAALRRPVENLGIALLPIAAASLVLTLSHRSQHIVEKSLSWQLETHILLSVLAYSILGLAAFQALLLALQNRQLHNRRPGGFVRALPPLQTMESLLFQMIGTGFVLLSLSLLTGVLFLEDIFAQHLIHKTVLSLVAWGVFAGLLLGRKQYGWRGPTAIRWTLSGFGFLMLAYFGSKLVLELVLGR
jgi:ABC-type uncharacterized transport system permease subunit